MNNMGKHGKTCLFCGSPLQGFQTPAFAPALHPKPSRSPDCPGSVLHCLWLWLLWPDVFRGKAGIQYLRAPGLGTLAIPHLWVVSLKRAYTQTDSGVMKICIYKRSEGQCYHSVLFQHLPRVPRTECCLV